MNTATKLLAAMRNNPRDWTIDQLVTVATNAGFVVRNTGGSHHVFTHHLLSWRPSIPARRPVKPIYVKNLIEALDELRSIK